MSCFHLKVFNYAVYVDNFVVLDDFKVILLLSNYREASLLYPWCKPHRNHVHGLRSKSSMYGSPHQQLCNIP